MILECNVWCSENDQNRSMGLPDGDIWMPIALDISQILTIKQAGGNDFIGENKSTIYIGSDHFVVDVEYTELLKIWKNEKK